MKKTILCLLLLAVMCGCSVNTKNKVELVTSSDTLYVRKIENLTDDFIMGMDASSVISLENSGVRFHDYNGEEADVFKVLAESGINYVRVRVWNDPYDAEGHGYGGGNCDINTALEIGKRVTEYGMKLLVDFHYSDFWADPSKQMCPKAWVGMSIEEKEVALYEYTKDCLQLLKDNKVDVGMVQLGNETNGAMAGETIWMNIIYHLMANGSKAVREIYPDALVAVHFANPEKAGAYEDYAKKLDYYSLDYDVFASSYYPFWHGTLDNLASVLSSVAEKYNKKVMVMETSYAYTGEDTDFFGNTIGDGAAVVKNYPYSIYGQTNSVLDVIDTVANKTTNGIGVCYWEGTWISVGTSSYEENFRLWEEYGSGWASSYAAEYDKDDAGKYYGGSAVDNQTFFDENGCPLESLKLFALARSGNLCDVKVDSIEDTVVSFDLAGEVDLPDSVNAVMTDNSKQQVSVSWNIDDNKITEMKSNGPAAYTITGTADGREAVAHVSMIEYNFLNNYSFEEDSNGTHIPSGWEVIDNGSENELYVEIKSTDSLSGQGHYHFWSAAKNSVNFDLQQTMTDLPEGTYKFTVSIMGGDAGKTNVYAYASLNGEVVATAPLTITSYNDWHTATVTDISYNDGDILSVGIHVECEGDGAGAWGKIDDALLNSQTE